MANKPILFSGIQPSGGFTLGNYLGAIKNWADLQHDYTCLFSLVDLHTITVRQDPTQFRENFFAALALNIACGLDAEKNIIFAQSHVPAHTELAWILNCYTYMGELNRMTQFKDKAKKYAVNINVGLFAYPVLMAADILLYATNLVPVGEDQKQHLELARDIALRFNHIYGDIFTLPEPYIPKIGSRIMSLQDATKKMSKSDENQSGVIYLLDSPETILAKVKRAVTDSGKEIIFDEVNKPGIANLLTILSVITNKSIKQLESEYQNAGYGKLKTDVADCVIALLQPVQQHYYALRQDKAYLFDVLKRGSERAFLLAEPMLSRVKKAVGFI